MKKAFLFILWVPSLVLAQTNGLRLAELRTHVLSSNPSVQEALQRIAAAEAVLRQARSAYLPTITLNGNAGHADASLHPDAYPNKRFADSFRQGYAGLSGTWLLFDGFAREARNLGSKYNVQRTEELANETRRLLVLSATVSFRQAQLAEEAMRIAEQDREFNTKLEQDALKRFEAGALPESDVQNFSIRALQAESAWLRSKLNYATACTVLAELMAWPDATLPEGMRPGGIVFDAPAAPPGLEEELKYALGHRPDYNALQSGRLALAQRVRAAKGEMLPQIAVVGEVNYTGRQGYSEVDDHGNYDSFVGVAASWDLFTGGRKINTVREAQAEMRGLEQQRESLRLSIRSTLRQRIDEAETARLIYEQQKKIYRLSQSMRDSVEKSYKAGAASITRLNEAQTDLVRAKGAYSTAFIAYLLSLNQLDIESGRILEEL